MKKRRAPSKDVPHFSQDEIEIIDVGRLGDLVAFRVQLASGLRFTGQMTYGSALTFAQAVTRQALEAAQGLPPSGLALP